eukprot:COSAG02_NODE_234_length_27784_cov_12.556872_4_plen_96_part_00
MVGGCRTDLTNLSSVWRSENWDFHGRVSFIDAFLPSWRRPGKCILKYRARGYAYSIGKAPTNGERFPTGDDRLSSGPKHSAYITMDTTYRRHAAS